MKRLLVVTLVLAWCGFVPAMASTADDAPIDAQTFGRTVDKAIEYLRTRGQDPDGSYAGQMGPGVTAVVTAGILRHGRSPDDPVVARSLEYLKGFVQPDGGIYRTGTFYRNYETSLILMCFAEANRNGRYDGLIANAAKFLRGIQWGDDEEHDLTNPSYGGAGYGKHKRPDLSNTSFLIDALRAAGAGPDDPAIQKALIFVARCQNLESEYNTTPFPAKNPDGGFYYTPAAGGSSQAGETPEGGLRSYGSMTYAGLKSMIYAGVGPDDPRVQAAIDWLSGHYQLESNPGIGLAGLYYYYHVFAKALDAFGIDEFEDEQGVKHDWRQDLLRELVKRQRSDGSWINEEIRWMEGEPSLVTGYALLALSYCRPREQ